MELFEMELEKATALVQAAGRREGDFTFKQMHLPPDPDDAVMFTARYEVLISDAKSGKTLEAIGGIGLNWVGHFAAALDDGYFG